jgi:nucleotide-binding universal stress UspA family protein
MAGGTGRIVVGVDGSDSSRAALRWALEQARLTGASVDAVLAWRYSDMWAPAAGGDVDLDGAARSTLAEVVEQEAGREPGMPVTQVVGEGHASCRPS